RVLLAVVGGPAVVRLGQWGAGQGQQREPHVDHGKASRGVVRKNLRWARGFRSGAAGGSVRRGLAPRDPLPVLEPRDYQQRQGEGQQQVEAAEHDQRGQHVGGGDFRQGGDEGQIGRAS